MDNPNSHEAIEKANEEALKETLEQVDKEEKETTPPDPEPSQPPAEKEEEPEDEAEEPSSSQEIPEEKEEKPEEKPETDFKTKYNQSSKEALILAAKNKKYEQISEVKPPTQEELKEEYPEWEELNETDRKLASDNLWNRKRFDLIDQINKESKDVDTWQNKVNDFVVDPKVLVNNPELEGKTEEFVTFATKPTRRGVDMEDLVLAFLGDWTKNKPAPKKGQMFEQGSAGPNDRGKQRDNKISLEDAATLMRTDYRKYKQKLIAGEIANE